MLHVQYVVIGSLLCHILFILTEKLQSNIKPSLWFFFFFGPNWKYANGLWMICTYCGSKHTANCCCHKWVHVTISPSLFQSQQYRHSFSLITLSHVPIINHTSPKRDPNDVGGCSSFAFDFSTKMTIWDGVWTQNLFKTWTVQPRSATPSSENGHALHALCWRPGCPASDRRSRLLANGRAADGDLIQTWHSV